LARALLEQGEDAHGLAQQVLDAGDPASHDLRALWYTGWRADEVWTRWVQARDAHELEPTEAREAAAAAARIDKWAFYDHEVVLRRLGRGNGENFRRCMIFTGVREYCEEISALDVRRTERGW